MHDLQKRDTPRKRAIKSSDTQNGGEINHEMEDVVVAVELAEGVEGYLELMMWLLKPPEKIVLKHNRVVTLV